MKVYNMSLEEIKREGIRILTKNLGIVGMIRFFQQIDKGWGDYAKEREKWLGNPSLEEIYKEIKKLKENI